jgi:hypothetical protein
VGYIEALLASLGISKASALAGAVGATLAALRAKGITALQRWILFTVGFFCAVYVPKLVIAWFNLPNDPSFHAGVGFVLGYFGPSILDAGQDALDKVKGIDWKDVVLGWVKK